MKYNQPFDQPSNPNASYVNGNPATGTPGSIPPAAAFENPQRELVNLITNVGLTPSDADLNQLAKAIQSGALTYAQDTGSANAYSATLTPTPPTLKVGMTVRVKIANANTGASTFNLNALGAASIIRATGAALSSGDMTAGMIASLTFDGTNWQLTNFEGAGTGGGTTTNTYQGLQYCIDSGTVNAITASFTPAITSGMMVGGLAFFVKMANTNTGAVTITVNSNAAKAVVHQNGAVMQPGDLKSGEVVLFVFDGTSFQIAAPENADSPIKMLCLCNSATQGFANGTSTYQTGLTAGPLTNILATSSWDGTKFTVGSGEDGLWHFFYRATFGNQYSSAVYVAVMRIRSGVTTEMMIGFMTYPGQAYTSLAEAFADVSGMIDLQVGDQIKFSVGLQGPSALTMPTTSSDIAVLGYRVTGLH